MTDPVAPDAELDAVRAAELGDTAPELTEQGIETR
jgi:hypothetical protein